ncbi:MAG: DUF2085 domain-containing protein [Promethearchaeota archaeon]
MTESTNTIGTENFFRAFFLNLLISVFIIMTYVYVSDPFGSISTIYVESQEFNIQFGITLLIFTLLSFLAGSYHGFIAGFLGELLYQMAFYHDLYLEWCIIVALLGFLSGIYKYKPLKYQEGMKTYYTFIILIIISTIITGIITLIYFLLYSNEFNSETIIQNFGFKFFMQSLISIVFIIPLLLVLYDRLLAKEERFIYNMLLTHHPISASDHTFYFKFGRTRIYLCSRCSGVILGGIIALFLTYLIEHIFDARFSPEIAVLLCIVLPIPGLIDWGSQRLLLRKSTTSSRLFTGFIIGLALHFMSFTDKYYFFILFLVMFYFTIFFLLVYFGHKKELKLLKAEVEEFSTEEQLE